MKARIPKGASSTPSNLAQLAQKAQKMQAEVEAATAELEAKEYTVTTGGSAVTIVMTGDLKVKNITISPEVVDPEDVEMLADLVAAAVNETIGQINAEKESRLGDITDGMSIPGIF